MLVAAGTTALAAGLVVHALFPPARSLTSRLNPYLSPTRMTPTRPTVAGPVSAVFGPMLRSLAASVGRVLERSGEKVTILELRQAGWYRDVPEDETVQAFRMAQLRTIAIGAGMAFLVGVVLGLSPGQRIVLVVLGIVIGSNSTAGIAALRNRQTTRENVHRDLHGEPLPRHASPGWRWRGPRRPGRGAPW